MTRHNFYWFPSSLEISNETQDSELIPIPKVAVRSLDLKFTVNGSRWVLNARSHIVPAPLPSRRVQRNRTVSEGVVFRHIPIGLLCVLVVLFLGPFRVGVIRRRSVRKPDLLQIPVVSPSVTGLVADILHRPGFPGQEPVRSVAGAVGLYVGMLDRRSRGIRGCVEGIVAGRKVRCRDVGARL